MKKILTLSSFLLFFVIACKNDDNKPAEPQDDVEAATKFIRSALDGNFDQARSYLLPDSTNIQYLEQAKFNFGKLPKDTVIAYKTSSIRIFGFDNVNDSTTVVIYANSFKNNPDTLKVLKVKDRWLVDLKYLYQHDMDTTHLNPVIRN